MSFPRRTKAFLETPYGRTPSLSCSSHGAEGVRRKYPFFRTGRSVVRPGQVVLRKFRQVEDIVVAVARTYAPRRLVERVADEEVRTPRGPTPPGRQRVSRRMVPSFWRPSRATSRSCSTPFQVAEPLRRTGEPPEHLHQRPPVEEGGEPRLFRGRSGLVVEKRKEGKLFAGDMEHFCALPCSIC